MVLGRARARQTRLGAGRQRKVLPIIIHGDAAFAGQGIVAESLVLGSLPGYDVGGTVHVIVNNLLGFTALPQESNCSRFATDLAKRLPIPIFHVNAEDPDAVVRVAAIAAEFRHRFHSDVLVDLIGYRRHGHSEVDDPTVTQPLRYAMIKRPSVALSALRRADARRSLRRGEAGAAGVSCRPEDRQPGQAQAASGADAGLLGPLTRAARFCPEYDVPTGLAAERIAELCQRMTRAPEGLPHPSQGAEALRAARADGRGQARLRLRRGRAACLRFPARAERRCGSAGRTRSAAPSISATPFWSTSRTSTLLSSATSQRRAGALRGLQLACSRRPQCLASSTATRATIPEALVLWEAQFGDFANGAQIIIDQFIAAGEAKWDLLSGLVLLLPHGYEGQGPEHSSARIERYLQLAANDNMQICQPSTAAQYFHLLRRQALRAWRKPLVVFTPEEHVAPARTPPPRSPTSPRRASATSSPTTRSTRHAACSSAPARSATPCASSASGARTARSESSSSNSSTPGPKTRCRPRSTSIPRPRDRLGAGGASQHGRLTYVMPQLRRMAGDRAVLSVKRSASRKPGHRLRQGPRAGRKERSSTSPSAHRAVHSVRPMPRNPG